MNNELDDSPPLSEGPETWARSCPTPWAEPAWWWARAPSPANLSLSCRARGGDAIGNEAGPAQCDHHSNQLGNQLGNQHTKIIGKNNERLRLR